MECGACVQSFSQTLASHIKLLTPAENISQMRVCGQLEQFEQSVYKAIEAAPGEQTPNDCMLQVLDLLRQTHAQRGMEYVRAKDMRYIVRQAPGL